MKEQLHTLLHSPRKGGAGRRFMLKISYQLAGHLKKKKKKRKLQLHIVQISAITEKVQMEDLWC